VVAGPWPVSCGFSSCDAMAGGRVAGAADRRCDDRPAGPVPVRLNVGVFPGGMAQIAVGER